MAGRRIKGIDCLRGISALIVVLFHYCFFYPNNFNPEFGLPFTFSQGHLGVHIFFVISGFVIYLTLDRSKTPHHFIVSRFSRLYPVYWVAALMTFAVINLTDTGLFDRSLSELIINLSMLQTVFKVRHVDPVYWSLFYELVFYFWFALIFFMAKRKYLMSVLALWLGIQAAAYYLETYHGWFPWLVTQYMILKYIHLFIGGIILHEYYKTGHFQPLHIMMLLITVVLEFLLNDPFAGILYIAVIFIFILIAKDKFYLPAMPVFVFFGDISYPLYLTHQFSGYIIMDSLHKTGMNNYLVFAITLGTAILVSFLLHKYVELPSLYSLRARLLYKDSKYERTV